MRTRFVMWETLAPKFRDSRAAKRFLGKAMCEVIQCNECPCAEKCASTDYSNTEVRIALAERLLSEVREV